MIEAAWLYVTSTSIFFAFWGYWLPVAICLIGGFFETVKDYKSDYKKYTDETVKYYTPELTVGVILGRILGAVIPYWNIGYAFTSLADIMGPIFKALRSFFDIPLVGKTRASAESSSAWKEYK